jgi:tRNA threonylcarbamoyladenosine biosynthesis protein TsaB
MRFLALETSTKHFSIAVAEDGQILLSRELVLEGVLSSSIIPTIEQVLKQSKIPFKKLDGFVVGLGPGSFTSLRVGLATVKALAYATGKPAVGIPSLDAIALSVAGETCDEICVIADARRNLLYTRLYEKNRAGLKAKTKALLINLKDLLDQVQGRTLFVGDGIALYRQEIERRYAEATKINPTDCQPLFADEKFWFPQAEAVAQLAWLRFQKKKFDKRDILLPLYLYPEDCQVQKK